MAATTWRMAGIDTFGGDLELSELRLWGATAALDAGATLTCSHAPMAGILENLRDGDLATSCRWRAADVRSPGFFIQWVTPAAVDAWCVRLASPAKDLSVARYDLAYPRAGLWLSARNGDLVYGSGLSMARVSQPSYGIPFGWSPMDGPLADSSGFLGAAMSADGQVIAVVSFGSTSAKLSLSKDGGATWVQPAGPLASSSGFGGIAMSADGQVIAVTGFGASTGKVSLSKDGGTTWTQPAGPVGDSSGFIGVGMSADGQTVAVAGYGSANAKLSLSKDGGSTWTQPSGLVPNSTGFSGAAVSADGQTIAAATPTNASAKLNLSRDGGATWTQPAGAVPGTGGFWDVKLSGDGKTIVATGQGSSAARLSLSRDGGATWTQPAAPVAGSQGFGAVAISADGLSILVGAQGSTAVANLSRDGGVTWAQQTGVVSGTTGILGGAFAAGGSIAVMVGCGSSAAVVSKLLSNDPTYVAQPLTSGKVSALTLPSEVQPLPQGLQGMGGSSVTKLLDTEFGGAGRIYGTVARKATPANTPLSRRVRLHRSVDGYLAREVWSKADGSYEFRELNPRYEYDVIAWDHELQEFSTVTNNQLAEVVA
jgi:hypothetical protein